MTATDSTATRDVVVVGGGPAGCSAAVFIAREGLDTAVFDRGTGSLDRCAFLTNYLGFPGGIDVGTFQAMAHAHAREAGAAVVEDLVETVERIDVSEADPSDADDTDRSDAGEGDPSDASDDDGATDRRVRFAVTTQEGRRVEAESVVAATRYDGSYLRPLVGDEAYLTHEHGGEVHEHFDPDYPDPDGRTPVDGLYVASPAGERDVQAIVAAGRGGHVGRSVVEDRRSRRGYPGNLAKRYDWVRPDSEFEGEWGDRERWREAFAERAPDDHDLSDAEFDALCEAYVDDMFDTRRSDAEVESLTERAHRRLLDHVDDGLIRERAAELDREGTDENAESGDGNPNEESDGAPLNDEIDSVGPNDETPGQNRNP